MSDPPPGLREFIEQRFVALELRLDDRRVSDQRAILTAKETADASLHAHNQLIERMERQAHQSQRQLDKLTATYATKDNLRTVELLLDAHLRSIDTRLGHIETTAASSATAASGRRSAFSDLYVLMSFGFLALAGVLSLVAFFANR